MRTPHPISAMLAPDFGCELLVWVGRCSRGYLGKRNKKLTPFCCVRRQTGHFVGPRGFPLPETEVHVARRVNDSMLKTVIHHGRKRKPPRG